MHEDREPPISITAYMVYTLLRLRGGSMRIGPLQQAAELRRAELVAALNELRERCRITITWRRSAQHADADTIRSRSLADIERVTLTRFGRRRVGYTAVGE